ncbi:MAG TPA: outer membrane beta-barrel protein [Solimonas sp.]
MHKFGKIAVAALVALPLSAFAQGLSYNYVEAGYVTGDADGTDFDGFRVKISGKIADSFYLFGSYGSLETDTSPALESDTITAGLGWRHALGANTDFTAEAAFVKADVELSGFGSDDDTGYGLGVGVRHLLSPQFELAGNVDYVDVFDDDNTSFTAAALYHFTPALSLGVSYTTDDDTDAWTFGGRFNF